jgi:peroxiredoxin Q/BCP
MIKLEGKKAPAFELQGSDGKTYSTETCKGRTVVLYFYPKDNTPGCTKEACGFRDFNKEIQALGATVLGVSKDDLSDHAKFIKEQNLSFVLLSDPDTKVMQAYGAWGEKLLYGKPVTGTLRSTVLIGPDGTVIKQWPAVKNAEEHPSEVLAYLKANN